MLAAKCQRCHNDPTQNTAPFPLLTWEDTQADFFNKLVWERMLSVLEIDFMPPTFFPNLQPPVEPLTAAEKQVLVSWLSVGAPSAQGPCP